jgi:hypothetical protein
MATPCHTLIVKGLPIAKSQKDRDLNPSLTNRVKEAQ